MAILRQYGGGAIWAAALGLIVVASVSSGAESPTVDQPTLSPAAHHAIDFAKEIQPLFQTRCHGCHGPDKQKNGLRLDRKEAALTGGDSGPAIVLGKSAESRLIQYVSGLDSQRVMPPKGERLTREEIGLLRAWVDQGAPWPDGLASIAVSQKPSLWSLQRINRPVVPATIRENWVRNSIDCFIAAELVRAGLQQEPEADRPTLIRRVTFDLTGLPATPAEIDCFVHDRAPDAYEKLVENLLARPQYGERWARHWLDVARYTESQGFEYDHMRENAWQYRDYVIESFNSDKPYNTFMAEQIAGDCLDPVTAPGIVATSFLVCGPWDQAGSSQANETQRLTTREEELEDMISVVSQSFLGLTVNCARCHSHKFDPIPQEDYYRIKAVFEGVLHGERPILPPIELAAAERPINALQKQISVAEAGIALIMKAKATVGIDENEIPDSDKRSELQGLNDTLAVLRAQLQVLPTVPVSYAGKHQQPQPTHRLKRGSVRTPLEVVRPGALSALEGSDFGLGPDAPESERRLRFARWISSEHNPLPARVLVNRLWHYHFGQGIVSTPNDFGSSGSKPTHPELLDWLAGQLIDSGWSIKRLQRLIVCSATYRQSSRFDIVAAKSDSDNKLLWRFSPRRLEAEELRDAMLAVSGELNLMQKGPSFRPFDTKSFNATFYFPKDKSGPEFCRRTVYRMNINSGKDPMLDAFDCPEPSVKTPRRGVTTTPLQALSLMNTPFVQRQAAALAQRLQCETGHMGSDAIALGYRYCLGREPSSEELKQANAVANEQGLTTVCWALLNATELLYLK